MTRMKIAALAAAVSLAASGVARADVNTTGSMFSIAFFGARPTQADNSLAITAACTAARARGDASIYVPTGAYAAASLTSAACNGITLVGPGSLVGTAVATVVQSIGGGGVTPAQIWAAVSSLTGTANGIAGLDANALLPVANLPTVPVAKLPVGTGANQVAAGNDSRITGALPASDTGLATAETKAGTALQPAAIGTTVAAFNDSRIVAGGTALQPSALAPYALTSALSAYALNSALSAYAPKSGAVLTSPTLAAAPAANDSSLALAPTEWVQALVAANPSTFTGGTVANATTFNSTVGLTGQVNLTGNQVGLNFWNGGTGQHSMTGGSSPTTDAIYLSPNTYGITYDGDLVHIDYNDNWIDQGAAGAGLSVFGNVGTGAYGNRTYVMGSFAIASMIEGGAYTGVASQSHMNASVNVPAAYGWPDVWSDTGAEIENGWDFGQVAAGVKGLYAYYGREVDVAFDPTVQVADLVGVTSVDQSGSINNGLNGSAGIYRAAAFAVGGGTGGGSWTCGYCVSSELGPWGLNPTGTILGAYQRQYGGSATSGGGIMPAARWDMDYRVVANPATGGEIALPGFGVDANGDVGTPNLYTSAIQAEADGLSGVTVDYAGNYPGIPTLAVQAPPTGGTTATATPTSVIVTAANGFGSTGSGYQVGDVLTWPSTVTGTAPTFTVASIDAQGGVETWTISAGAFTSTRTEGIIALSGGHGTGANILPTYGTIAYGQTNAGAYTVTAVRNAATGAGWAVGDHATIVGDTGTAGVYTVTKVTAQGGIMMPLTVSTPGSQTAVAAGTSHALTASGAGTGGLIMVGYGLTTAGISVTPGSGYTPGSPPLITSTETNYQHANLTAAMTSTPELLALNPSGGAMSFGAPQGGCPATTADYSANADELNFTSNCAGDNALAITQSNTGGYAALTLRGPDSYFTSSSGAANFEHAAFGYGPTLSNRGQSGYDFLEISRYNTAYSATVPTEPFYLQQTGGTFSGVPSVASISVTAGSTSGTVTAGYAGNGVPTPATLSAAANGEMIESVEYVGPIAPGTKFVSGQGTSSFVLSKPAVSTANLNVVYGPTTYCQDSTEELSEAGPINFYTLAAGCNGVSAAPYLTLDRYHGWVGMDGVVSPIAPLDVAGSVVFGTATTANNAQRYSYGLGGTVNIVTPGATTDTVLNIFKPGTNRMDLTWGSSPSQLCWTELNNNTSPFCMRADGSSQSQQVATPLSAQSAAYTLLKSDCGTKIRDTGTTQHTYTIGTGLPIGCHIDVIQAGAGSNIVKFAAGTGETLEQNGTGTLANATTTQFAKASIDIDSASTFLVSGQVQ